MRDLRSICPPVALCVGLFALGCAGRLHPASPRADADEAAHYPGPLPEGVVPRRYDVTLTLDPELPTFHGTVAIAVELREPHERIYLHAEGLQFDHVWATGPDGHVQRAEVVVDKTPGLVALQFVSPIPPGMSTLRFAYQAPWSEGLLGLYRTHSGEHNYIFSQFEPIAARRAFPSFDEPRFKTPFEVKITAPKELTVLSSSAAIAEQVQSEAEAPGRYKTVSFAPTPPLPTYLVAFAVGAFDVSEGELSASALRPEPLPLHAYGVAGSGNELMLARRFAASTLSALETWTDLAYPYSKLDLMAVPDFAWGAMENVGLVTFRDHLLRMSAHASYSQRRGALSVIAHELTHQWFGNWVTMPWWNDLWLNESFATWRGQKTAQSLRPHMHYDVDLVWGMGSAMNVDRFRSTRRIREPCLNRDDIFNAADAITYQKGAGVLTMVEHWLGSERMMQGVRQHLAAHPHANADSTAFLTALARGTDEPMVVPVMQSFLDQPGVPEVEFALRCDDDHAELSLAQDRYRPLQSDLPSGQWNVPVCVRFGAGKQSRSLCRVLSDGAESWPLPGGCPQWLVANADGAGYYRARYDAGALVAARNAALQGRLTLNESIAFLDNAAAALGAGTMSASDVLPLMLAALQRPEPLAVRHAAGHLSEMHKHYVRQQGHPTSVRYAAALAASERKLATTTASKAAALARNPRHGAQGEAAADEWGEAQEALLYVRQLLAREALEPTARAELSRAGVAYLSELERRHGAAAAAPPAKAGAPVATEGELPNAAAALATAAEMLGEPFYRRMVHALTFLDGGESRRQVVAGLSTIASPTLAGPVRELALAGTLHLNEVFSLFARQMGEPAVQRQAWAFVVGHLDLLRERLGVRDRAGLASLAGGLCDAAVATTLPKLFASTVASAPGAPRVLAQTMESMILCDAEHALVAADATAFFAGSPK